MVNAGRMGNRVMGARVIALLLLLSAGAAQAAEPAGPPTTPRLGFVTSVTGTSAFGTWPDAGGQVGIAAADQICRTRATVAGLADPSSFVAWLSNSTDDAWCRIQGLSGKRANNCGQAMLPANAGPWQRTDGQPLMAALPDGMGLNGAMYTSISFTEFGQPLPGASEPVPTGSDVNGEVAGAMCDEWTNPTAFGTMNVGASGRSTESWTQSGGLFCGILNRRLFCLQAGPGPDLPVQAWGRLAFLTASTGAGRLGDWPLAAGATGPAAGDAICRAEASAAGLPEPMSFKAWLSDATSGAPSRFQYDGPWRRPDGVRVAANLADLVDGRLNAPINQTLDGTYYGAGLAWTGTTASGATTQDNCQSWTSRTSTDSGTAGWFNATPSSWTNNGFAECDLLLRLYCLSDSDQLFADGFDQPGLR